MRAMVLCAGYGTRLGDLTREVPKPMLPIEGRPLLEYILRHLARQNFRQIAINLHFKPEIIQDYFGDGSRFGVELVYSYETELLGTAGAIKKMESFLKEGEAFLVYYGDVLTNQDFAAMQKFHLQKDAWATLLLHQHAGSNSVVTLDHESRIVGFLERPDKNARREDESPWVNSGVAFIAPALLETIPEDTPCDLPRDIYTKLVPEGKLFGFPLDGFRCAVDSPERLEEARRAAARKIYY